jgi:exonuclease SbcC
MDLEKWDYYKTKADAESQVIKSAIEGINHRISFALARLDELKSKDFTKDKESFEDDKNYKLLTNNQSISTCKDKIKDVHSEISEIKIEDMTKLEITLETMETHISVLETEQHSGRLEEKEMYSNLSTIKNNTARVQTDIQNIRSLTGTCPTCFSEITEHNKLKCIKELEKQLHRLGKDYVDIVKPYNNLITKNNSREDKIKEEREKLKEVESTLSKQSYLLHKKELLESTRKQQFELLERLQDERKEISKAKFPGHVLEEEVQKESKSLVASVSNDIKEANLHENRLRYYEFWGTGFSNKGIKSYIFDQIVPELTIRTNKYISSLTNSDITVNFDTQRENKSGGLSERFTIIIADKQGERPYNAWSGGEKKRISVAIDLALADIISLKSSKFWNLTVFDEIFDGLDEEGKDMMMYLLEDIMKERKRVIIISHDATMKGVIDNRVVVIKKNGVSRIEES